MSTGRGELARGLYWDERFAMCLSYGEILFIQRIKHLYIELYFIKKEAISLILDVIGRKTMRKRTLISSCNFKTKLRCLEDYKLAGAK